MFSILNISQLEEQNICFLLIPKLTSLQKGLQKMLLVPTRYNRTGTENRKDLSQLMPLLKHTSMCFPLYYSFLDCDFVKFDCTINSKIRI